MMKNYYITDFATWKKHAPRMQESHWVYLPVTADEKAKGQTVRTTLLLVSKFLHEGMELLFRSEPTVQALPHMLSRRTLSADHQSRLSFAGVTASDSTFDAMEKVSEALSLPLHNPIH